MKFGILWLVLIAGLLVSGCSKTVSESSNKNQPAPTATATPDEFASTRVNYAKHCVVCHGVEGEGGVKTVDKVKLKVPSFSEGRALKHTDEDFVEQIMKGGDGMPEFKDKLSPAEINELVRFIHREFQGK